MVLFSSRSKRGIVIVVAAIALGLTVAAALVIYLSLALPAATTPRTAIALPAYSSAIERSRSALLPLLNSYPALSVSVTVGGQLVWSEALGWSDIAGQKAATPATRFRLYSNAKPMTAALALRLAEQQRLDLTAPIGQYLPALPPASQAITTHQLLGHLAGIRDYRDGEWMQVSSEACSSAKQGMQPFMDDALLHSPGSRFSYASFGYVLASAVIEAASKQSYYTLLQSEILQTAHLSDTSAERAADPSMAIPYAAAMFGRVKPAPVVNNSCKFGAGGLVSTSADLARFGAALLGDQLISASSRAQMLTASIPSDQQQQPYGLGLGVATDPQLGQIAAHSGGAIGGRSYLLLSLDHTISVAVLGNLDGASLKQAAWDIVRIFAEGLTQHSG